MRVMTVLVAAAIPLFSAACVSESEPTAPLPRDQSRLAAAVPPATTAACGETVTTNLRLESDLDCPGDGLLVDADGITINLNGHTITGSGAGIGITVRSHSDVTIQGGTVRDFASGIFVATSTGVVIKDNGFTQNREAVFFAGSSGNVVKSNVAWQNTLRGIMIRPTGSGVISTDNLVVENILTNNPSGVLIFGQPGNTLVGNTVSGSSVAAIDLVSVGGSGNVIKGNLLTTSAAGIRFGTGWTDNTILGNTIQANSCGIQGTSDGNTIQGNTLSGNTADFCS